MLAPTDWPGPTRRVRTRPLMGALMEARSRFSLARMRAACWAARLASASRSWGFLRTRSFGSSSKPMSFQLRRAWAAVAFSWMSAASDLARAASALMIWAPKSAGSSSTRTSPFWKNAPSWNLGEMWMTWPATRALSVVVVFVLTVPCVISSTGKSTGVRMSAVVSWPLSFLA